LDEQGETQAGALSGWINKERRDPQGSAFLRIVTEIA